MHSTGIRGGKPGRGLTNFWANTVLSPPGKCSSSANTTQLAMIVNNTAYSKGGHSMMNRVYFLIGLSSVRMNNDVGPPPGGFSSFFGPPILSAKRWAPFRPKCPPPKESCWCSASTTSWAASNLNRRWGKCVKDHYAIHPVNECMRHIDT